MVFPLKYDQAHYRIFVALRCLLGKGRKDERVGISTPSFSAVHSIALLSVREFLRLGIVSDTLSRYMNRTQQF